MLRIPFMLCAKIGMSNVFVIRIEIPLDLLAQRNVTELRQSQQKRWTEHVNCMTLFLFVCLLFGPSKFSQNSIIISTFFFLLLMEQMLWDSFVVVIQVVFRSFGTAAVGSSVRFSSRTSPALANGVSVRLSIIIAHIRCCNYLT